MSKTVEFFIQGPPETSEVLKSFVNALPRHSDNTAKDMFMDTFVHLLPDRAPMGIEIKPNPSKRDSHGNRVDYYYYGPPTFFDQLIQYTPPWHSAVSSEGKQKEVKDGEIVSKNNFEEMVHYAVCVYTEAARKEASISVNKQSELTANLNSSTELMKERFTIFYVYFIQYYYPPTRDLHKGINNSPEEKEGFRRAILSQNFINNVNILFQSGGDDSRDATNDMFNLIISAQTFGMYSMSNELVSAGMNLPEALRGKNYEKYPSWFKDGISTDVFTSRMSWFKQDMRMRMSGYGSPLYKDIDEPNGYCKSYCHWSDTSFYN